MIGLIMTLALAVSTAMVSAQDDTMRPSLQKDSTPAPKGGQMDRGTRGGIGTGNAIGIGIGVGGLIMQEMNKPSPRGTASDSKGPDARKAKRLRKENSYDKKVAKERKFPEAEPDEVKFVGKPDQIIHDPKHRDGKLGDLHDHKQVIVTKDGSLFTRHYYYRRDGKLLTWYWYDDPLSNKNPDVATLKDVPYCDGENDDDCDRPSGKLPPYVVEIDEKKEGAGNKEGKEADRESLRYLFAVCQQR